MKKLCLVFLTFFSFILFVDAGKYSFDNGKTRTNNYLESSGYTYSEKYLLRGNIFGDSSFTNGGFINLYEYKTSKNDKGETYLYDFEEYWTMTKNNTQYYVVGFDTSNTYKSYTSSASKNVRITEYIKNLTRVTGVGSYTNPYRFIDVYRVLASSNSYGSVSPSSQDVYGSANITLNPNTGYEYNKDNCDGTVSGNKLNLDNIKNDISCYIEYKISTYSITYNYNGGTGSNRTSYTINDNFTLSAPTRLGYTFTGWTGSNGTTPQKSVTINNATGNKTYTANWEESIITYYTISKNYSCANITVGSSPYVFTYGGKCELKNDSGNNWVLFLYGNNGSGTYPFVTTKNLEIDLFMVSGGAGGGTGDRNAAWTMYGGTGGRGGKSTNVYKQKISIGSYSTTVGAGGGPGSNGGTTSGFGISASCCGGAYGGGGGFCSGLIHGAGNGGAGGTGVRAFGGTYGSIYYGAGGGGGGGGSYVDGKGWVFPQDRGYSLPGSGGTSEGGSGGWSWGTIGGNALANTGSGGGGGCAGNYGWGGTQTSAGGSGGSGVIIIRNAR